MAGRGTAKARADAHEIWIAHKYDGTRTKNSGAGVGEKGDVRTQYTLIECKCAGSPGEKPIRKPALIRELEKITNEAHSAGKDPVLALRYFLPDSPLANRDGWVDVAIRSVEDDIEANIDGD